MVTQKREFRKPVSQTTSKGKSILPGTYPAKIIAIGTPEGYADGDDSAMFVRYEVYVQGNKVQKDENFFLGSFDNPRLDRLDNFLLEEGCQCYDDAVGKSVILTFAYEVKRGRKYCNIVSYGHIDNGEEQAN